jgi:hypothetical protein
MLALDVHLEAFLLAKKLILLEKVTNHCFKKKKFSMNGLLLLFIFLFFFIFVNKSWLDFITHNLFDVVALESSRVQ